MAKSARTAKCSGWEKAGLRGRSNEEVRDLPRVRRLSRAIEVCEDASEHAQGSRYRKAAEMSTHSRASSAG